LENVPICSFLLSLILVFRIDVIIVFAIHNDCCFVCSPDEVTLFLSFRLVQLEIQRGDPSKTRQTLHQATTANPTAVSLWTSHIEFEEKIRQARLTGGKETEDKMVDHLDQVMQAAMERGVECGPIAKQVLV
jgi:hypothetical protein